MILDPAKNPVLFLALFFPAFAGIWCGTCYLLSKMSGWQTLAEKYAARGLYSGETQSWQSGRMGFCSYRNCLTVGVNHQGLYLAVMPIFALGATPLLIPWHAVSALARKKIFFMTYTEITVEFPPVVTLQLYGSFFDRIRPWVDPQKVHDAPR